MSGDDARGLLPSPLLPATACDAWLDVVEPELSAFPYHDWNQRVTAECYRPNTAAAVLAPDRRLHASCDNFAIASFDVVGTLHSWLASNAPDVDTVVRAAVGERTGGQVARRWRHRRST